MRRLLASVVLLAATLGTALTAAAGNDPTAGGQARNSFALAVIGDSPYSDAQEAAFPDLVEDINRDRKVRLALHLGDIKSGSSLCSDEYFGRIRGLLDSFVDPLVYTPGDNEWTDCHRPLAGSFLPTERLARVRETFYPEPGSTLGGRSKEVLTQADFPGFEEYVENQAWIRSKVVFSAVHVVGSNNDLEPWFGAAETAEQRAERLAEYEARLEADLEWLALTFELADATDARGVVVAMQADMWDAFSVRNGRPLHGFNPIVQRLAELASDFDGPVLVLQGDSHEYLVDRPLAAGSPVHGVSSAAPNLTRIVVQGSQASEWLRLTVSPRSRRLFSWERVQVSE